MTSFPGDSCFGSYDFDDESTLSYMGQAPGFDQTYYRYHLPGCNNTVALVEECFYCSGNNFRGPSLSPPAQYTQPLPIIRERSPTPSRTYAQAAAQGLRIPQVISPAALAASRQLRPHASQQSQFQAPVRRTTASPSAQRYNVAQAAHQRSYAQAAQHAQSVRPRQPQASASQPMQNLVRQSIAAITSPPSSQGHGSYQDQVPPNSGYAGGQAYLDPPRYPAIPQRPLNPAQAMLQIPMDNLNRLLRPEYTDNPRNIDNLVQGTQRGSHRRPMSTHSSGNSTPLTPASPDTMSLRSGSSHASRRRGSALRDPSLPHRCPRCETSFSKPEDLRRHCQRSHTVVGQRPHPCRAPGCNWAFNHPKDLRRHAERHHLDPSAPLQIFPCPWAGCTKGPYTRADNLQRHIKSCHDVDSGLGSSMSRTTSQSSHYTQPQRN